MAYATAALAFFLLILQCSSAFMQTTERPAPIRPVEGRSVFENYCASCHGVDGRGNGPVSGALRQAVPDLTTLSLRNGGEFPGDHVRKTILLGEDALLPAHGSKTMPIWGPTFHEIEFDQDLGNVRLKNIVNYLRSIQRDADKGPRG